jgi:hypothetical protein
MAYDIATNQAPEALRQYGMAEISRGAITGNNARLLEALGGMGVLNEGSISRQGVGGSVGGLDADAARSMGMTPIAGSFQAGSGGTGGTQGFVTRGGQKDIENLMTGMGGDNSSLYQSLGGKAAVESALQAIKAKKTGGSYSDAAAMKEFMELTGADSRQAYTILGNRPTGDKVFDGDLEKRFDASRQYQTDPTAAADVTRASIKDKSTAHLVSILSGGHGTEKTRIHLAKMLVDPSSTGLGLKDVAEALGIDEADAREALGRVEGGDRLDISGIDPTSKIGRAKQGEWLLSPYAHGGGGRTDELIFSDAQRAAMSGELVGQMVGDKNYGAIVSKYRAIYEQGGKSDEELEDLARAANEELMTQNQVWKKNIEGQPSGPGAERITGLEQMRAVLEGTAGSMPHAKSKSIFGANERQTPAYDAREAGSLDAYLSDRRHRRRQEHKRAKEAGRMAARAAGGIDPGVVTRAAEKFKLGHGTPGTESTARQTEDFETEAMEDISRMFIGMSEGQRNRAITSFAKGGTAFSGRAAAVGANVRYYTTQWEDSKNSPAKFLARITHDPEFNKLTRNEKQALRGDYAQGFSPRLQSLLEESARDILIASGKPATRAAIEGLATDLVSGTRGDQQDREKLYTHLSTNYNAPTPGTGRGGGAGAQEVVSSVLAALAGLAGKLAAWTPGQVGSYGGGSGQYDDG